MSEYIDFGVYKDLQWDKLSSEYLHGLADMGNTQAKEFLENRYNSPIEDQIIGFGKYSTRRWVDVDTDYLYWILNNVDTHTIKYKLALRALEYIKKNIGSDEFMDVIYVD